MDYEIIILATQKDYNKLPYVIESINKHIYPKSNKINIIHNSNVQVDGAYSIHEREVLDLDPKLAKGFRRPGWIYQQFVKLFQNITNTDMYLVVDADLIINKRIYLFTLDNRPYFYLGNDQNHQPYFNYMKDMFGIDKVFNHSFISEIMVFNKHLCNKLLIEFYQTVTKSKFTEIFNNENRQLLINALYILTCNKANDNWIPSEYEIYGNFIQANFPNYYEKRKLKSNLQGKYKEWTNNEIQQYIHNMIDQEHDIITLHTWE